MGNGQSKPRKEDEKSLAPSVADQKTTLIKFINTVLYSHLGDTTKLFLQSTMLQTERGLSNNAFYVKALDSLFDKKEPGELNSILERCGVKSKFVYKDGFYMLVKTDGSISIALPSDLVVPTGHDDFGVKHTKASDFISKASASGFNLVDVPGDGHCFYHAVAHQLQTNLGLSAAELHQLAIDHIITNQSQYIGFMLGPNPVAALQAYIGQHLQPHTWADSHIIQAMANALNVNVNVAVFNANGEHTNTINIQPFSGAGSFVVSVANFNNQHFLSHLDSGGGIAAPDPSIAHDAHNESSTAAAASTEQEVDLTKKEGDKENRTSGVQDLSDSPSTFWYGGGWSIF